MRIAGFAAAFGLAALVSACASTGMQGASPAENAQAAEYGNYLSARFAASQHNLKDAAAYYRASVAANPNNPQLLGLAFFFATSSGDIESAGQLAEKVVAFMPDDRAGRLTLAVVAMKHRDYAGARKIIAMSAKGPFTSLTVSLIDGWAAAGLGDKAAATADIATMRAQDGADTMGMFHLALLSDYLGDKELAETSYRTVMNDGATPRVIDAYGRFLERSGRTADATSFYTKFSVDSGVKQIAAAGLARIKTGVKPDALVTKPEDGAAEALFGIASALTDQSSVDVSILYLRLALYLRPSLDLGAVLLADRLEGL
ncbi:MAG: tetratricopeptide repeat protein, partial [Rhizomicrobium sp.]